MNLSPRSTLPWLLGGGLLALLDAVWIAQTHLTRQREAFDTDARIAHRLLSQRAVQHDAILATLALLQAGDVDGPAPGARQPPTPEQRLPAVYPQVLRVLRRDRAQAWPTPALAKAEALSRQQQAAVLAEVDFANGRYTVLRAAEPASFALQIDLTRLIPWSEWPLRRDGPVRALLEQEGQHYVLNAGSGASRSGATAEAPGDADLGWGHWQFTAAKHLATSSQPFNLVSSRVVSWTDLPWRAMAGWVLAVLLGSAALWAAQAAWQRQRQARRRAEARLRLDQVGRLNALGELAAGMAHELNQPLTAVLANTQAASRLLDEDPPDLDTARHAMTQAAQQARRASAVLSRLRHMVQRPEADANAGHSPSLAEVARKVLDLLAPEFEQRGFQPELTTAGPGPRVAADPVALEQIVHNLLMNALQALDQVPSAERRLQVTVALGADGLATLAVRDSGPGIDPEALPHLFDPFFTTRDDGLGLGLSLCETLAQGMGGTLSAANKGPRGAEFCLRLPATADAVTPAA